MAVRLYSEDFYRGLNHVYLRLTGFRMRYFSHHRARLIDLFPLYIYSYEMLSNVYIRDPSHYKNLPIASGVKIDNHCQFHRLLCLCFTKLSLIAIHLELKTRADLDIKFALW